jgi:transposase
MFFDEARFGLQTTISSMWRKVGLTLNVKVKQGYENFYLFGAVSPITGECFPLILPRVDTDMMNLFLSEMKKEYPEDRIILIMDRAGWHVSKELIIPDNIEIIFLPAYSPELNPVERLWKHIKASSTHNRLFNTLNELEAALIRFFEKLTDSSLQTLCSCHYL